jgi:hypothetical protein
MAEQIKFGDRLFLRGEKTIFDNGLDDAIIEARNGTLEIRGNLVVTGTTTTVNSEQTSFADPFIVLNGDFTGPASEDVGIEVNRGDDPNVFITWDEVNDRWSFNDKDVHTTGTIYAQDLVLAGSGLTYSNAEPTPSAFGGVPAGTTFDQVSYTDMFTALLYPYQEPSFTYFSISGVSTTLEVGEVISAGDYTFNWGTTNPTNINTNSITIRDVTANEVLGFALDDDGVEVLTLPTDVTKTSATSNSWNITATNTQSTTFSRNFSVNWRWMVYHGTSADAVLDELGVKSLINSSLSSNFTGNKTFAANDYKWMAYPTAMGLKTNFFDQATGFGVAMEPAYTLSVTNDYGVTTDYYVHRTTYTIVGAITIGVS